MLESTHIYNFNTYIVPKQLIDSENLNAQTINTQKTELDTAF